MSPTADDEIIHGYKPFYGPRQPKPVLVDQLDHPSLAFNKMSLIDETRHKEGAIFLARPLLGPLLFENNSSDARDHCANERSMHSDNLIYCG
jgi:hypothetical protein